MFRVYVAGPMSLGDKLRNLNQGLEAYRTLLQKGFAPFCPHLSALVTDVLMVPYETWIATDLEWVKVSHALLRLPGESKGAEEEVRIAKAHNIPVFYSIGELVHYFEDKHGAERPLSIAIE